MKRMNVFATVLGLLAGLLVSEASALDVDNIVVNYATNRWDGAIAGYAADLYVQGIGITGGKIVNTMTAEEWPLTVRPDGTWGVNLMYASLADFQTHHPNPTAHHFYFNQIAPNVYQDQVLLGYAVAPPDNYVHILYPLHGAVGVPSNPLYQSDNIVGLGWAYGTLVRTAGPTVLYRNMPDFDLTETSWQPGPLDCATYHEFLASVYTITGGRPLVLSTLNGDPFAYYGLNEESNMVTFTTIPEPMSVMLVASGVLTAIGLRRRRRMK